MDRKAIIIFFVTFAFFLSLALEAQAGPNRIKVSVSVPPQAYFVERIGGDRVETQVMLPGHSDHDTYQPTPQQLIRLSQSRVYVKVGVHDFTFEARYIDPALAGRKIKVIDMSQGVRVLNGDPHIWTAPAPVRQAALNIYRGLSEFDPPSEAFYKTNLDKFLADIDSLDREIKDLLKGKAGGAFLIYHPALGYFAAQYGLIQLSIETEGKTPSASQIRRTIETARGKEIRTVLVQKGFDRKNASAIAADIGGKLEEIDPLERDWLRGTRAAAIKVSSAVRK